MKNYYSLLSTHFGGCKFIEIESSFYLFSSFKRNMLNVSRNLNLPLSELMWDHTLFDKNQLDPTLKDIAEGKFRPPDKNVPPFPRPDVCRPPFFLVALKISLISFACLLK